jgi:hypothetical protein
MSAFNIAESGAALDIRASRPVELICFGLCVAQAAYLAASLVHGTWLIDASGHPIPTDFLNVWAAGRLVLDGHAQSAYDWTIHQSVENTAVGYAFGGYYAWLYPPPFLLVAAALATFPIVASQVLWLFVTFPAYVAGIRTIVGDRIGYLLACAFPALTANFIVGQNGFFSAALLAGTLGFLERRPLLSGIFLGLLSYKPHLGILFPIVLALSGQWRVIISATLTALVLHGASWIVLGTGPWLAFFHSLPIASQSFLAEGNADWGKLQTVFGLVRSLDGGENLAWALQGATTVTALILVCAAWRARIPYELKAAALAVGALLATPYLYLYDLVALAVPMAFLVRAGLSRGFLRGEMAGLAAACLLILIFPLVKQPVGALATFLVAALIVRHILHVLQSRQAARAISMPAT